MASPKSHLSTPRSDNSPRPRRPVRLASLTTTRRASSRWTSEPGDPAVWNPSEIYGLHPELLTDDLQELKTSEEANTSPDPVFSLLEGHNHSSVFQDHLELKTSEETNTDPDPVFALLERHNSGRRSTSDWEGSPPNSPAEFLNSLSEECRAILLADLASMRRSVGDDVADVEKESPIVRTPRFFPMRKRESQEREKKDKKIREVEFC